MKMVVSGNEGTGNGSIVAESRGAHGKIYVSPSLVEAYIINLGKAVLLIGALVGAFYLVSYLVGENPFVGMLETLGVPVVWVMRGIVACMALYLVLIIFDTLSLTSYELIFEGDSLTYSYGSFFKVTESTKVNNVVRVNFKEYSLLSIGEVVVEFTGTDIKNLTVRYVKDARKTCADVNVMINAAKMRLAKGAGNVSAEGDTI